MGLRRKKTAFPQSGIIAHDDIRGYFFGNVQVSLKHQRVRKIIIRIHEEQILSVRQRDPLISGAADALTLVIQTTDP